MFKLICESLCAVILKLLSVIEGVPAKHRGLVVIVLLYCLFGRELPLVAIATDMAN